MKTILVAGGAGYIGSHTCVELLEAGFAVVVVDNLYTGTQEALKRVDAITGKTVHFELADIREKEALVQVFSKYKIDGVIHFAGLKSVAESVEKPELYYDVNVHGTSTLLDVMATHYVKNIVFSSSATVYGISSSKPISENSPKNPAQPYGETKLAVEEELIRRQKSDSELKAIALRYFNPVGAHPSGLIGEDQKQRPNNLMPYITQVAGGVRDVLEIFGNDYPTHDGTGVRDYIHVTDLAKGHVEALSLCDGGGLYEAINLGTGRPYSVLEMVAAFEQASGKRIPVEFVARRPGDLAMYYADTKKAEALLGWKAMRDISDMARDAWNWQKKNPNGYNK